MRILIVNPFGIGDVLFTTPVIRALKQKFPDSFIGYLCNRQLEPVLKNNPAINELFFYSRGDFKDIKKESKFAYIKKLVSAIMVLRSRKFYMVIDLSLVSQYSFILWLAGIKKRWGFDYKNRGRFLTDKIRIEGFSDKHVIEYYKDLLRKSGVDKWENKTELFLDPKDRLWAEEFLKNNSVAEGEILIGISPFGGSSWGENAQNKQWDTGHFANTAKKIIEEYKARVIIFGSEKDRKESVKLEQVVKDKNLINAVGKTTLGQLAALINKLNLFIGNDSGPLHMACALGVKTVSLFGPVDERVYGPFGNDKDNSVVSKALNCRPCYKNFKIPVCKKLECLLRITEEDVLKAARRLL